MRDRYSLLVGAAFLVVIAIATIHTLTGGGGENALGLEGQPPRWPLPQFAVPAAFGAPESDANVVQDDCGSSSLPCPGDSVRTPACRIQVPGAIRVCDLFDRPLVISFWFDEHECPAQQDVVESAYERYRGRVNFLSLDSLDSRETVRGLVRENGWKMPVGYDRDGAVATLYRVGGCPTYAFVYPGGTLEGANAGELSEGQLDERVARLLRASAAAASGR